MHCHEVEARIQELLDERRSPADDPALASHAAQCAACRAVLSAWTSMLDAVSVRERPVGRADLASRVLADLRVRPAADRSVRRPALRWAALATAAALLIAATVAVSNKVDQRPVADDSRSPPDLVNTALPVQADSAAAQPPNP